MNCVNIVGRLTRDPERRQTASDYTIVGFSVAVNRQFKNKNTGEYEADFINCTAFGKTAEFVQKYFSKGQFIGVTGRLQTRKWQADDGTNRTATDVVADSVHFTSSANNSGGNAGQASPASNYSAPPAPGVPASVGDTEPGDGFSNFDLSDDELPF